MYDSYNRTERIWNVNAGGKWPKQKCRARTKDVRRGAMCMCVYVLESVQNTYFSLHRIADCSLLITWMAQSSVITYIYIYTILLFVYFLLFKIKKKKEFLIRCVSAFIFRPAMYMFTMLFVWCICVYYCCRFNSLDSRFNRTICSFFFFSFFPFGRYLH